MPRSLPALIVLLLAASALAQTEPVEPAPRAPAPFDYVEIPSETARLSALHAEVKVLAAADSALEDLRKEVNEAGARTTAALVELRETLAAQPRLEEVDDLELEWEGRNEALGVWRAATERRLEALEESRKALVFQHARWEATLAQARDESAPSELRASLQDALGSIQESEREVSTSLGRMFAMGQSLSRLEAAIEDAFEDIRTYRGAFRASLFDAERPPLWTLRVEEGLTPLMARAGRSAGSDFRSFVEWWAEPESPRGRVAGLVLGALVLILGLRVRSRQWPPDDPRRERGRLLLMRPWSMALVAGLSLAALTTPKLPRGVTEIFGLLFLVPALRVFSVAVPERFYGVLIGLAGFYVFDRVRGILLPLDLLERWLLLLEMLAALGILLWMLGARRRLAEDAWYLTSPLVLWLATRAGVVLLAGAVVANVLGYVELSRLVGQGVLNAVYLAVAVIGVLQVARNFLAILLGSEIAKTVRMVRLRPQRVERALRRGMGWAAGLGWLHVSLGLFGIREAVYAMAVRVLTTPVTVGEIDLRLGDPALLVVVLWIALELSRFLRFFLQEEIFPRVRMQRGVPNALSTMLHYGLMLLGLWIGFSAIGLAFDRLAIVLGALGVGIGFGLQNVVNNFVSGLILLFERPVQVGDTLQMGTVHGDVRRIGARSSTIRTWDGSEIIVPNSDLVSQQVINWTLSDRRSRIEMDFGVAYGTDPEAVQAILVEAASQRADVLETPRPEALFMGFGDSALLFQLRAWVAGPTQWFATRSAINVAVNAALRDAGIEVPFPQRDVHFRSPLESRPAAEGETSDPAPQADPKATG